MEAYPKVYLYKRIVQAKMFIDESYAQAIDLNDIADEATFSKFHFIRLFKQIYGKTPHQYLVDVRLSRARQLLLTDVTIMDVCLAVGFDSVSSFSGLFKRSTGMTPAAYRNHQLFLRELSLKQPRRFVPGCFAATT